VGQRVDAIEGSQTHRGGTAPAIGGRPEAVVPPADLAGRLWDMYTTRDRAEDVIAPALASPATREKGTR
jgi:hypothetical protein